MKRCLSLVLALLLAAMTLAGCGGNNNDTEYDESIDSLSGTEITVDLRELTGEDGIYTDITGIPADQPMLTINGQDIPARLYFYWLTYMCANLEYNISYYSLYGYYTELVDSASGRINWDAQFSDGLTLGEYALAEAEDTILFYTMLEQAAVKYDAGLNEENLAIVDEAMAAAIAEQGGELGFSNYLVELGIDEDTFFSLSSSGLLLDNLLQLLLQEDHELYLPLEEYDAYATYADHILLSTIDLETGEALSQQEIDQKYAVAEDLLAQLQAVEGEELATLFKTLADEHSEDTGRQSSPNGYIYVPGTMVQSFEDAAAALQPGQLSGIVESEYGYHIILRKDLLQALADDRDQRLLIAEERLSELIRQWGSEATVERAAQAEDLDVGTFFQNYQDKTSMLSAAKEASTATNTANTVKELG